MDWFRMYSEARNDAKLRSLTDSQHRVWFNLLCFANEQEQRGSISGYDEELLAVEVAGGDVELLRETLGRLQRLRILSFEESTISFINFKKRNYEKPSDAPEATRQRKRRQREKGKEVTSVTPGHADVTPCHAPYTDTDTDTDIKDLYPEEESYKKQLLRDDHGKTISAAALIKFFEKDFGRPLGSTESEQVIKWLEKNEPDVIKEALRRAVLNGKYNFKYIDRILLSWEKANKRTLREVLEYEAAIERQRARQSPPAEDAAKVVQISDKRREETIRSACEYIRLQCGPDPPREKAEDIAKGYGAELVPAIIERLYGGLSP